MNCENKGRKWGAIFVSHSGQVPQGRTKTPSWFSWRKCCNGSIVTLHNWSKFVQHELPGILNVFVVVETRRYIASTRAKFSPFQRPLAKILSAIYPTLITIRTTLVFSHCFQIHIYISQSTFKDKLLSFSWVGNTLLEKIIFSLNTFEQILAFLPWMKPIKKGNKLIYMYLQHCY